jgi:hypothetical protein
VSATHGETVGAGKSDMDHVVYETEESARKAEGVSATHGETVGAGRALLRSRG